MFDYSQQEACIFADRSQETFMLEVIRSGEDIHHACAEKVWGGENNQRAIDAAIEALEIRGQAKYVSPEVLKTWKMVGIKNPARMNVNDKERIAEQWLATFNYSISDAEKSLEKKNSRTKAKTVLYLKVYGGGANALAAQAFGSQTDEAVDNARIVLNEYSEAFPRIEEYSSELTREAKRNGYIINAYGVRINVPRDYPYKAANYDTQGSAASQTKRAMIRTQAYLDSIGIDAHMVITMHDEIVFEIRRSHCNKGILGMIRAIMEDSEGAFDVLVPVDCERAVERWDQSTPVTLPDRELFTHAIS